MMAKTLRMLISAGRVRLSWILFVCDSVWVCLVVPLAHTLRQCDLCDRHIWNIHCLIENLLVLAGICGVTTLLAFYSVFRSAYKTCHKTMLKYRKIPIESVINHTGHEVVVVTNSMDVIVVDNTRGNANTWCSAMFCAVFKLVVFVLQMCISVVYTFGLF